jgi:hypothetical protein
MRKTMTGNAGANVTATGMSESHDIGFKGRPSNEELGRDGAAVTLPYSIPQVITRMGQLPPRPPTTGVSAVVPYNYTIVDTKTLGGSSRLRTTRPGPVQE